KSPNKARKILGCSVATSMRAVNASVSSSDSFLASNGGRTVSNGSRRALIFARREGSDTTKYSHTALNAESRTCHVSYILLCPLLGELGLVNQHGTPPSGHRRAVYRLKSVKRQRREKLIHGAQIQAIL